MSAFSSKLGSAMTEFLDYRSALGYSRVHFRQALQILSPPNIRMRKSYPAKSCPAGLAPKSETVTKRQVA